MAGQSDVKCVQGWHGVDHPWRSRARFGFNPCFLVCKRGALVNKGGGGDMYLHYFVLVSVFSNCIKLFVKHLREALLGY